MAAAPGSSALAFRWGQFSHQANNRTYYHGFTLCQTQYDVGATVFLLPEEPGASLFIGRLTAAFVDSSSGSGSYSIEVRWFERLQDQEVVELEQTDINPAGCLAGLAPVIMAEGREQAELVAAAKNLTGEWFFCRGVYKQATNEFVPYSASQLTAMPTVSGGKRRAEDGADSGDAAAPSQPKAGRPNKRMNKAQGKRQPSPDSTSHEAAAAEVAEPPAESSPAAPKYLKGKGPGQQCVECGATQTPQWREGPAGPKTLCNACGVRYNRLRANKRGGGLRQFHSRSKSSRSIAREPSCSLPVAVPAIEGQQDDILPVIQELPHPSMQRRQQQQQQQQQLVDTGLAPSATGRPVRQAALASANRTAAIARMGVLAEDDEEEEEEEEEEHEEEEGKARVEAELAALRCGNAAGPGVRVPAVGPGAGAASCGSTRSGEQHADECSLDSSRSAEGRLNRLQVPTPTPTPAPVLQQLHAGALHSVGSSVGLDLLCDELPAAGLDGCAELDPSTPALSGALSLPQGAIGAARVRGSEDPASSALPTLGLRSAGTAGSVLRRVALRAVGYCPDAAEFGEVFSNLEALQAALPDESLQQLLAVAEQVEAVAGEAAEADAALQAVSQLLAARQKAASASRERAISAVEKLKGCMSDLVQQHSQHTGLIDTSTSLLGRSTVGLCSFPDMLSSHDYSDMLGLGLGMGMDSKLRVGMSAWGQGGLDTDQLLDSSSLLGLGGDNGATLLCVDGSLC